MKPSLLAVLLIVIAGCTHAPPGVVGYTPVDQVFSEPLSIEIAARGGIPLGVVYDTEESKNTGVLNLAG